MRRSHFDNRAHFDCGCKIVEPGKIAKYWATSALCDTHRPALGSGSDL